MVQGIFRVIYTLTYNALLDMNLFTPRASRYSTIPYDSIVEYASKAAGITENDMRLTMEALMEAFSYYLCNGHSFKLDGVGTFSLSANTKTGDPTSPDCLEGADAVERLRVNFLPDVKLKNLCNGLALYTESENPNNLTPTTSPVLRTLVMNGAKLVSEGVATEEGSMEKGVNVVTVSGYNIPKDAFPVIISGKTATNQDATYTLNMKADGRDCLSASAKYDANTIKRVTSVEVFGVTYEITGEPDSVNVSSMKFVNQNIFDGAVVTAGSGILVITGSRLMGNALTLDGDVLPLAISRDDRIEAQMTLSAGAHSIGFAGVTYAITAVQEQAAPSVQSLTANGISAANGSSSPILSGSTYNFVAVGQNLGSIQSSDIQIPTGATLTNFQGGSERITFTVTFGNLDGSVRIGQYFYVNVIINDPAQTVTSVAGVANGGNVQLYGGRQSLSYVASAQLNANQIKSRNGNFTVETPTASSFAITLSGSDVLTIVDASNDELTIFTLNITMREGQEPAKYFVTLEAVSDDGSGHGQVAVDDGVPADSFNSAVYAGTHIIKAIPAEGSTFEKWTRHGQEEALSFDAEWERDIQTGVAYDAHFLLSEG